MLDRLPSAADHDELGMEPAEIMKGKELDSVERDRSLRHAAGVFPGKGHSAVRAMRRPRLSDGEPWQKHELFPAPPWATRTLFEHVVPIAAGESIERDAMIAEPAAGLGHMSDVIAEYADRVFASDIYRYPCEVSVPEIAVADFLEPSWLGPEADWIVTNPPFRLSRDFLELALVRARRGVAFLQRMQWLEGKQRYRNIYAVNPPALLAPFSERVAMCEGGWDPECATATMYAWFVWVRQDGEWPRALTGDATLRTYLIPPGRKEALSRASDAGLAARCVPGFVPPSRRKGKGQGKSKTKGETNGKGKGPGERGTR